MSGIQILSDLHLEFHRDGGKEFINSLDPKGVDVLVVAGDLCTESGLGEALKRLCDRWPHVVFVCGNHEYYHSSPERVTNRMFSHELTLPNLTWLNNKTRVVAGVRFVGGTLWFPRPSSRQIVNARKGMNDFRIIKGFEPWVYEQNKACEDLLWKKAKFADVVVTHHIPTEQGILPRYRGSPLNHYFCRDLTPLIEEAKPPLWLFGHTHSTQDFTIGETRLVANPLGYPQEQGMLGLDFDSRLLIEVNPKDSP